MTNKAEFLTWDEIAKKFPEQLQTEVETIFKVTTDKFLEKGFTRKEANRQTFDLLIKEGGLITALQETANRI